MYLLNESIEIAAPPKEVRSKFLDFSKLPQYHPYAFFKSIGPVEPGQPLEPGVKIRTELKGGTFVGTLLENSETRVRWVGSIPYIFTGEHIFRYEPSSTIPGGTKFVQEEQFTGLLAFLFGEGFVANWVGFRETTRKGWERYNHDLKKWCEEGGSGGQDQGAASDELRRRR